MELDQTELELVKNALQVMRLKLNLQPRTVRQIRKLEDKITLHQLGMEV